MKAAISVPLILHLQKLYLLKFRFLDLLLSFIMTDVLFTVLICLCCHSVAAALTPSLPVTVGAGDVVVALAGSMCAANHVCREPLLTYPRYQSPPKWPEPTKNHPSQQELCMTISLHLTLGLKEPWWDTPLSLSPLEQRGCSQGTLPVDCDTVQSMFPGLSVLASWVSGLRTFVIILSLDFVTPITIQQYWFPKSTSWTCK